MTKVVVDIDDYMEALLVRDAEIKRLREALGNVSRMKVFPDAQTNQFTLTTAIQIAKGAIREGNDGPQQG